MPTTKKTMVAAPGVRKKLFRATTGLSIAEQLEMASQMQSQGDDVLKTIKQMTKASKNQKEATKATNLKFEWFQEHNHLKKLEENCSKELESLLLRMFNDASTVRGSKKQANDEDSNCEEQDNDVSFLSTSTAYATELEDLIRTEQLSRVALIKQISSEREQRAALNQLLSAFSQERGLEQNNQSSSGDMQYNVHGLVYDAIIGRQMVQATLEDEVQSCENDFAASYKMVLETLRGCASTVAASVEDLDAQDEKITAILDAAGGTECPDEMLRIEMYEAFLQAYADLRNDLSQYEQEFVGAASAADAAGSIEAAKDKCGGWDIGDDERFVKVLRSYERKHGTGTKPHMLYDQLALVVPSISLIEIKKHVKFHQHLRFHQQKCKDRQRELQRRVEGLQIEAASKFQLSIEQEQEKERKLNQLTEMQHQCEQRHGLVSEWRVTKEAKERIEKQQREIEQVIEAQKLQEEELRWKKKHDQQKLAVEEYKKDKALGKMAEEEFTTEEEQKRQAEKALQSVVNAERVQYRHDELQQKLEAMKMENLHKVQLEEQRLAKLNELKETTPYAQIIANIAPDPERTRQDTIAFRANVEATQEGLAITETGLFPSHGYDCETLFKNARFKLGIALRNAGLSSSDYARQALANVKVCNVGAYRNHVAEPTTLW